MAKQTVTKNSATKLTKCAFTKTGYSFKQWSGSDGKTYQDQQSVTLSSDLALTAQWTGNVYRVTLDRQSGSGGSTYADATYGAAMPTITKPTRTNYNFGGYFTGMGGSGTKYYNADGTSARTWDKTSVTTLYAYWTEVPVTTCSITFSANGGSGTMTKQTVTKNSATKLNRCTFTRAGYSFKQWSGSDGKTYQDQQSVTLSSDLALTAQWTGNVYRVTFDRQSGSGGSTYADATYGAAMPTITKPTRTNYNFGGYFTGTGGSGTKYYNADGTSARTWDKTSATTLYAYWTEVPVTTCSITFSANGGSGTMTKQTVTKNSATKLNKCAFTKSGYSFKQWSGFDGKTYQDQQSVTLSSDLALTAQWTGNVYRVTLDRQSGSGGSTYADATYGAAMPTITKPTRTNYNFGGYFTGTNGSGTKYYNADGTSARTWDKTSATTLYAYWTEVPSTSCTVTFNANGGSGSTTIAVAKNNQIGTLPTPTRNEYAFLGWFTAQEGGTKISATAKVTNNVTYYAHWQYVGTADGTTIIYKFQKSYNTEADGTYSLNLSELIGSTSVPKVTVKGLPSGLKYDTKEMTISGKAIKPGVYTVTISATNSTVKKPVTTTFDIVVPNLQCDALPGLKPDSDAYGIVWCGVAFDSSLVDCTVEEGWAVKVSGLPTGLKWDAKNGCITGVPTKAGTFTVTFTASKKGAKSQVATITLKVKALPEWATGTFTGRVHWDDAEHSGHGYATMTVSANGKISGKAVTGATKWTFTAASYDYGICDDDGSPLAFEVYNLDMKSGKIARIASITVDGSDSMHPTLMSAWARGDTVDDGDSISFDLCRTMWKDKSTASAAKAELAKWDGVYTLSFEPDSACGSGYLSLTVGKDGNVKATGKLADGTSVSVSSPLVYDGRWFVYLHTVPSAYKGGEVALSIDFNDQLCLKYDAPYPNAVSLECSGSWYNRNPQASAEYGEGFYRDLGGRGSYYNKLTKLYDYYRALYVSVEDTPRLEYSYKESYVDESGRKISWSEGREADAVDTRWQDGMTVVVNEKGALVVAKATKPVQDKETKDWIYEGANDGALTLSFTQTTGIFKGSYTFWYDYLSAYDSSSDRETYSHTSKKVNFEGIMVQGEDKRMMRGFYLWDATGTYWDEKTDKEKSYKYKQSYPVILYEVYDTTVPHDKVQLWEGGPYWATKNIGAESPEDYGYYFWWGDTVGYRRNYNGDWVASDGSSSNSPFGSSTTPTHNKSIATLQREGWVLADGVLSPEHDAAQVHWGGSWRMPTCQELYDLCSDKCDWSQAMHNGVNGYVVRGRGNYASNSIFLPCAGDSLGFSSGSHGYYWSSSASDDNSAYGYSAYRLSFFYSSSSYPSTYINSRYIGQSIRPVQGSAK